MRPELLALTIRHQHYCNLCGRAWSHDDDYCPPNRFFLVCADHVWE